MSPREFGFYTRSRRGESLHHRRSLFSQAREIISLWRSQARQPGLLATDQEGQLGARVDALDHTFSRREGRSEAVAASGSRGFELWLGLGSTGHDDASPRFTDRLQRLFSRRRGVSSGGNDRVGLLASSRHSSGSRRLVDVRNFLLGPGGDLLIQQLIEGGDAGRHGSAPASKAAVEAMPTVIISKQSLEADDVYCAVCKEVFEIGGEAREMPCKHIYHSDCILPWLALHNSCPMCRHEMPFEESPARRAEGSSDAIQAQGNVGANTNGERGLAIVGIPGIGILVRSFSLFGNGAQGEAFQTNATAQILDTNVSQGLNVEASAGTPNVLSRNLLREAESAHNEESSSLISCEVHSHVLDNEATSALRPLSSTHPSGGYHENMQAIASQDTRNFVSGLQDSHVTSIGGRNFFSWLSCPSSSAQAQSFNLAHEASSSNSRRRRFWFLDH